MVRNYESKVKKSLCLTTSIVSMWGINSKRNDGWSAASGSSRAGAEAGFVTNDNPSHGSDASKDGNVEVQTNDSAESNGDAVVANGTDEN